MRTQRHRVAMAAGLACVFFRFEAVLAQSALDGPARLTADGQTVEEALRLLRQASGVTLVYSPDLLPTDRHVRCPCQRLTVREALDRILEGTGLTYRYAASLVRIVPGSAPTATRSAGCIVGRVVGEDGVPVVNAMIQLADGRGSLSDPGGWFILDDVPVGEHRLQVTSIGWKAAVLYDVEVVASDTARVTITLARDVIPLPEIVVAPGTFSILEDVPPQTVRSLTREEIETMPQVGEDIFRSLKRLPGVASHDISTRLNIRGGEDREVAVRLDGLELYEPYHMKDWDGALSIIDLNALGGVELAAGGFGVEQGDKMTGILDMKSRTAVGEPRTTLGLSVTNVTAVSRGGFADDRGSWLLSARRGFMGILIRLIGEDQRLSPQYYDLFGKVSYAPNNRHVIHANVLHAGDHFGLHDTDDLEIVDLETGWGSSYGWLTWEARLHPRVSATTVASVGRVTRDRDGLVEDPGRADMPEHIMAKDRRAFSFVGLRHDLSLELTPWAMLKLGGEVRALRSDYEYVNSVWTSVLDGELGPTVRVDSVGAALEPHGSQLGAWLAARVRPVPALTAEVGARYDRVSHTGDEDVSPRFLASVDLGPRTKLRASWGRYRQSHGIQELEVGDGETQFYPAERADQAAIGFEHRFRGGVSARIEAYERSISNQRPRFINLEQELQIFPEAEGDRLQVDLGRGRARGIEVVLERQQGARWAWSATYALALAEDEMPRLADQACAYQQPCTADLWVPRRYDQRHAIGLLVSYRPDARWHLSAGWRYHTGWPATSWTYAVTELDGGQRIFWQRVYGPVRGERLPSYHRMDLRVTRDFVVGGNPMQVYLDVFNLYNRGNLGSYGYDGFYRNGAMSVTRVDGQTLLPRLPTIGFRYEF
jgi:outer membrane receptor protein involved in Fe transport